MDFTADDYFQAAAERMGQAQDLYDLGTGHYALAMYTAGLAVECLLRSYMVRRKKEFESRHDLLLLFKESGMARVQREKLEKRGLTNVQITAIEDALWTSVNDVFLLWRNDYRFASERRLRAHFKRMKLYRGVKGDLLKAKACDLMAAAQRFVDKGSLQWQ